MRKYIIPLLAVVVMCPALALPASAQKSWTSGFSGITHEGYYPYWLYAVKAQGRSNTVKRNLTAFFIGMGYDHKINNTAALDTREKLLSMPEQSRAAKERAFRAGSVRSGHTALIWSRRAKLGKALKDNDIFKDYVIFARQPETLAAMSEEQFAYLQAFFKAPAKRSERGGAFTPERAIQYKNGIIVYGFENSLFLVIDPADQTLDVCTGGLAKYAELNSPAKENLLNK